MGKRDSVDTIRITRTRYFLIIKPTHTTGFLAGGWAWEDLGQFVVCFEGGRVVGRARLLRRWCLRPHGHHLCLPASHVLLIPLLFLGQSTSLSLVNTPR
jgi:hypothetical protein